MSRSRLLRSIAAGSFGILLLGACSADALGERAAGFGLERAIEANGDVDVDFGGDGNGGFNISTDEGEFSLNFDQENGGISFNGPDGDGQINFGDNGITFDTDQGSGALGFDQENGSITFDTDDGAGSLGLDDDGGVTFDSDQGSIGIFGSSEAPPSWPSGIAAPQTLVAGGETFSVLDLGAQGTVTTAIFMHAADEPYADSVVSSLLASGWDVTVSSDQGGTFFAQLGDGNGGTVQVIGDGNGTTTVSVTQGA